MSLCKLPLKSTPNPEAKLASQCYSWAEAEASHRASASVKARVLTEGFALSQQSYQSNRSFPQARTDADTQGKIHRAQ